MMQINFDLKPFLGAMKEIPEAVKRELRKEMKQQGVEIQKLARNVHRHQTRTNSLNNSIEERFDNETLTETVGFNPGVSVVGKPGKKVNYGKYVHEGHGKWKPDRFLYEAIQKREPLIVAALESAVKRGIEASGV